MRWFYLKILSLFNQVSTSWCQMMMHPVMDSRQYFKRNTLRSFAEGNTANSKLKWWHGRLWRTNCSNKKREKDKRSSWNRDHHHHDERHFFLFFLPTSFEGNFQYSLQCLESSAFPSTFITSSSSPFPLLFPMQGLFHFSEVKSSSWSTTKDDVLEKKDEKEEL